MPKVKGVSNAPDLRLFLCPGCKCCHYIHVRGQGTPTGPTWEYNGDVEKPTFNPSIMVSQSDPTKRCHSFVKDGRIQFLDDCAHELKGQTVDLEDFDHDPWFDQKD